MIRKRILSVILTIVIALSLIPANITSTEVKAASSNRRIVGYLPSYRGYDSIDWSAMTHCILSFATYAWGNFTFGFEDWKAADIANRCHANGTKCMIAVGGWGGFDTSDGPFTTPEKRTSFINQIMDYVNRNGLDGVDLDLEVTDGNVWGANFEALASELSSRLHAEGKLFTIAVGTWFTDGIYNSTYNYFDFVNLMSYDADTSGNSENAPWWQVEQMVAYYSARGVSNDRMTIGVPFYGYGPGGTAYTYAEILGMNYDAAKHSDSVNGIFYNCEDTIRAKAEYSKSYGGTMIWEIGQDAYGGDSLLGVIKQVMASGSQEEPPVQTQPQPTQPQQTEPQQTEAPTTPYIPSGGNWSEVVNSNGGYEYANANNMEVVNVQQPAWAGQEGIYISTTEGIGYVTINDTKIGAESAAIDGAGAVIYLSALTNGESRIIYYRNDGSYLGSVDIKKGTVATTAEQTTPEATQPQTRPDETTPAQTQNPGENTDISGLTFQSKECDGMPGLTLDFAVQSATVEGLNPWYGDGGNTFMLAFAGDGNAPTVTINGQTPSDGVVTEAASGCVKVNPNLLANNAYTTIKATTTTGEIVIVVKRGTPSEIPTQEQTTTQAEEVTTQPSGEVTTVPQPGETTPVNVDTTVPVTDAETTKVQEPGYNPDFNLGDLTYTAVECDGMPGLTLGYAEQSTTIDGLVPWYGDAGNTFMFQFSADSGIISSVTINGQTPSDGVVTETTKGCVKINPNLLADNAYHVITVKAENGEFTVVIKRGTPSDIPTPAVTTSQDGNITTTIPEGDITTPSEGEVTEPNTDSDITTPVIEETTKNTEDDVTTPAIEGNTTTPFVEPDTTTPVVTIPEVTTPEYVTPAVTTPEYTTPAVTTGVGNTTTATPTTKAPVVTTAPTTKASVVNVSVGKTKVKKVTKKLAAKKAKISLKSISGAKYQVKVSTVKSFKAKKTVTKNVTKATFTVNSSKIKGKKVLYVKARAYKVVNGTTYYGNWSKVKKVKIKK